jgi:hypothetical protein
LSICFGGQGVELENSIIKKEMMSRIRTFPIFRMSFLYLLVSRENSKNKFQIFNISMAVAVASTAGLQASKLSMTIE